MFSNSQNILLSVLLLLPNWFAATACKFSDAGDDWQSLTLVDGYQFPYDLEAPDTTFLLPDNLLEISALSTTSDPDLLAAVQDELGIIFKINKKTGQVEKEITFREPGDYEGVEMVGDVFFVIKSNGDLFKITGLETDNREVKKIETILNKTSDTEGLGYDPLSKKLLVACKGMTPSDQEKFEKSIFTFDLETETLDSVPLFSINLATIQNYLNKGEVVKYYEKLMEGFHPDSGGFTFAPSGIAVHPLTGEFYILSSVGKMLMVLDRSGQILHIEKLKKKIFAQPEGICFEPDGTLWISSEGKEGKPGSLSRFWMR